MLEQAYFSKTSCLENNNFQFLSKELIYIRKLDKYLYILKTKKYSIY
jgi:hypothetical protein